jgi:hypothetical protein
MIGNSIYSLLSGHEPLTDIVGLQIYPVEAPQGKKDPMVIFGITQQTGNHTKDQLSPEDWIKVEVVVYSKDYDQSHAIHKEIRAALDGEKGTIADNEISQISFMDYEDGWEEDRKAFAGIATYQVISTP